jgi:protein O-mannosyl-transferase
VSSKRIKKKQSRKPRKLAGKTDRKQGSGLDHKADVKLYRCGLIAVFALACLLYANTLGNGYTQDDAIVITDNMLTKQGIKGIPGLITKDTFFGFFKTEGKSRLVAGGRYRPLTPVMFAIEYQIFGEHAWIGHLMNLLLYGVTGVIIYLLLFQVLKNTHFRHRAFHIALIVALLYVAHPLHTEVVANIKGRDEIMSMLLALAAVFVLIRSMTKSSLPVLTLQKASNPTMTLSNLETSYWESSRVPVLHYLLSGVLFFLALTSKENAITFLAVVPLLLYYFSDAKAKQVMISLIPFVLATVVFLIIRGQIIGWDLGDPPRELLNNPFIKIEGNRYVDFTFGEKSATIMYTLGKYLQLLFFPHPLTHDYYPRHIRIMHWTDWQVVLSAFAYAGLMVSALLGMRKKTLVSFGILFYLITLSIVSNIVFPVGTNMSERFMFMPSLGWAIALTGLIISIKESKWRIVGGLLGVVLLVFCVKTIWRNTVWKNNYTLFTTDINTSGNSAKLLAATAGELITTAARMPEGTERDAQVRQGLTYLVKAQKIHPNYKMSYLLRGLGHYYLHEWDQAIASYGRVMEMDPGNPEATKNLGIVYRDAGKFYGQEVGDLPKSIDYLAQALALLPTDYETVHSLGVAYGLSGQTAQAVEMFLRGVELMPDNATAHFNLGLAYQQTGDLENAAKHRKIAIQLDPEIINRRSVKE